MNDCKNYEQKKKTLVCECKSKKFYEHGNNHNEEPYRYESTLISCVNCGRQYQIKVDAYTFEKTHMVHIKNDIKDVDAVVLKFE